VWRARASRLWNRYLRLAAGLASLMGSAVLTLIFFVVLPPFAWFAKRALRREAPGWTPISSDGDRALTSQY